MSKKPEATAPEQVAESSKQASAPDLLERLAALEAANAELQKRNQELKEEAEAIASAGGLRYSPKEQAFAGPNGYLFEVTPMLKEGDTTYAHLKPRKVKAVDESEALRWYCQVNEMKPGSGRAVDPLRVRLTVKVVGRERADSILRQRQIAALRLKVQGNQKLSEKDEALLAEVEDEIYGYSNG
jgi:hypothetical protein